MCTGSIVANEEGCSGNLPSAVKSAKWAFSVQPRLGWGDSDSKQKATAGWLASLPVFEPHWQVILWLPNLLMLRIILIDEVNFFNRLHQKVYILNKTRALHDMIWTYTIPLGVGMRCGWYVVPFFTWFTTYESPCISWIKWLDWLASRQSCSSFNFCHKCPSHLGFVHFSKFDSSPE